jgi:hypothetical protein
MGLMNFINLAHGAFAMAGGYITGGADAAPWRAVPGLPAGLAFVGAALLGAVLERTLYRPMYRKPHLDQVLFSIGLTFMAVATVDYFMGSQQQIVQTARVAARPHRTLRAAPGLGHGALPPVHHRRVCGAGARPAVHPVAHPLRQPAARQRGRPAGGRGPGHQRQPWCSR